MTASSAIGGYFGLELGEERSHRFHGFGYSTMRGALQDVVERLVPRGTRRHLWFPSFICPTVRQAFRSASDRVEIITYHIGHDLQPLDLDAAPEDLVYHYAPFGLLPPPSTEGILVDNAHSLFQAALPGQHTFYSPRKFIGIPDGALLCSPLPPNELPAFHLDDGAAYLLRRIDQGAESGFGAFQAWEERLYSGDVLGMSAFSRQVLARVDRGQIKARRTENFRYLHTALWSINALCGMIDNALQRQDFVPFSYPFLHVQGPELRRRLISCHIYTPTLWAGLDNLNEFERYLADRTVHCPVDQRYCVEDMDRVVGAVHAILRGSGP